MEQFSKSVIDLINKNKLQKNILVEVNIDKLNNKNENLNDALNFSNLDVNSLVKLFEVNEKLKNDFFKFGIYKNLEKKNLAELLKRVECPYSAILNLLEYILENDLILLENFLIKNKDLISEKELLYLLKAILNFKNEKTTKIESELYKKFNVKCIKVYFIHYLIDIKIEKDYFFTLLKKYKGTDNELNKSDILELFNILIIIQNNNIYKNENILEYFSIMNNLLMMLYLKEEIEKSNYEILKNNLDSAKIAITNNKTLSKSLEKLNLSDSRILKYNKSSATQDLVIEYLHI